MASRILTVFLALAALAGVAWAANYHPVATEMPGYVEAQGKIVAVDPSSPPAWVDIVGPDWAPPMDVGAYSIRVAVNPAVGADIAAEIAANGSAGTWTLRFMKPFTQPPADVEPLSAPGVESADSWSR